MKFTQKTFFGKRAFSSIFAIAIAASIVSCTTDNEEVSFEENTSLEKTNEAFSKASNFIPDPNKVYTITSSTTPLIAAASRTRLIDTRTDIPQGDLTVRELWRITPSSTPGSYYIDNLGDISNVISFVPTPRLGVSTSSTRLAPTFELGDNSGSLVNWAITPTGDGDFFITNLSDVARPRLTSLEYGFRAPFNYGLRLTDSSSDSDTEKFVFTEVEFPFAVNRDPIADNDGLSFRPFQTRIINVAIDDFDPDGDDITLTGFEYDGDDRISVTMIGDNQLEVSYNTTVRISESITYFISDGNGGTDEGTVSVFRGNSNF